MACSSPPPFGCSGRYRFFLRIIINIFEVLGGALAVLAAKVERQVAALAAVIDQDLRRVDLVLVDEAVAFENVGPATGADVEVQSLTSRRVAQNAATLSW
jgi:hypothetical protein